MIIAKLLPFSFGPQNPVRFAIQYNIEREHSFRVYNLGPRYFDDKLQGPCQAVLLILGYSVPFRCCSCDKVQFVHVGRKSLPMIVIHLFVSVLMEKLWTAVRLR